MLTMALLFYIIPLFFIFFITRKSIFSKIQSAKTTSYGTNSTVSPKSYSIIRSWFELIKNRDRFMHWTADLVQNSPTGTFSFNRFGRTCVVTVNPANVERVLKTRFEVYKKGAVYRTILQDLLGDGIFNADDENWRFQRKVAVHEFTTRSLRTFVETVVDAEIADRLVPVLSAAAAARSVLDLQDVLQRFTFDNICKIAFGFDPACLSPSLPAEKFAEAFSESVRIIHQRFYCVHSGIWKAKRFLRIGSEKRLRIAISEVREFVRSVIREKRKVMEQSASPESGDLLSRFMSSGHSDDDFIIDIAISFILAGRDTTSSALTWFFWLIARNPEAEIEIRREIGEKSESPDFEEVKHMAYTHAALCESMRLYPPVPADTKEAASDDVWDDGTVVRKGMRVVYHSYAMGRSEALWGPDWPEYRPERWLRREVGGAETEAEAERWRFVGRDAHTYPVFQAGPRVCIAKDMAFLQMKRVVAGVMRRFRIVPAARHDGVDPVYVSSLTSKMKGGFPVYIEERT